MADHDHDFDTRQRNYPAYEEDFAAWIAAQIDSLRQHRFEELDVENLLDEVEGLANSNFKAFTSAIRIVLVHMMKWDVQVDRRSRSWSGSIDEHRRRVTRALEDSPSYKSRIDVALSRAYADARHDAAVETRLPKSTWPEQNPFTFEQVMRREHVLHSIQT